MGLAKAIKPSKRGGLDPGVMLSKPPTFRGQENVELDKKVLGLASFVMCGFVMYVVRVFT